MFLLSSIRNLISWNFALISWAFTPLLWIFTPISWAFTPLHWTSTLISWILTRFQEDSSVICECDSSWLLHFLQAVFRFEFVPGSSGGRERKYFSSRGEKFQSQNQFNLHWLGRGDIKPARKQKIGPGGFAKISEMIHDGRKVVLKFHCYRIGVDTDYVFTRFCNEVEIHNCLLHEDVKVVPLVGAYSTETHPIGLVYEYMEGSDLKQYLRESLSDVKKLQLLIGIAMCLESMHQLNIVHEDFQTTNILVDKVGTPRIGGLGNAFFVYDPANPKVGHRTELKLFSPTSPPESLAADAKAGFHRTKASDIYALGIMIFEVLTGQPPFKEKNIFEATDLMKKGNRPLHSDHPEISDSLWDTIEKCWHNVPSKRISAKDVLCSLLIELHPIATSANGPAPDGGSAGTQARRLMGGGWPVVAQQYCMLAGQVLLWYFFPRFSFSREDLVL